MTQCPFCGKVYDEFEHCHCPRCANEEECETSETKIKTCPDCGSIMHYWSDCWECSNCDCTIDTDEDDYDSIF